MQYTVWIAVGAFLIGYALGWLGRGGGDFFEADSISQNSLNHILRDEGNRGDLRGL